MSAPDAEWFASRGVPHFWACGDAQLQRRGIRLSPTVGAILAGSAASLALFTTPRSVADWIGIVVAAGIAVTAWATSGLSSVFRWAWRDLQSTRHRATSLVSQGLPLLLVLSLFSFFSAELWQTFGRSRGLAYGGIQLTMFLVGAFFVSRGATSDEVPTYPDSQSLASALAPDDDFAGTVEHATFPFTPPPFTKQERHNLIFVQLVAATIVGLVMAASVSVVLLAVSFFAIDLETTRLWVGADPYVILSLTIDGRTHVITSELLHVVGFVAMFCGMASAANALGSPTMSTAIDDGRVGNQNAVLASRAVLAYERSQASSPQAN